VFLVLIEAVAGGKRIRLADAGNFHKKIRRIRQPSEFFRRFFIMESQWVFLLVYREIDRREDI
jgi:hypothetical protein